MPNLLDTNGIAHVGYIVKNREEAVKRLSALYDIKDWFWVEFKPFHTWYKGKVTDDYFIKIAISLPADGTRIEVLEPVSEGLHMEALNEGIQSINHVCHVVDDYDKFLKNFIDKGADLVFETEYEDTERGYRRCCYVYDAVLNTMVEIAEKPYFRKGAVNRK